MSWFDSIPADVKAQFVQSLVVLVGTWILWKLFVRAGEHYLAKVRSGEGIDAVERAQRLTTLWQGIRRVLLIAVLVVVVLTVLAIWQIPIGSFVAVGSVVGVALGFGAQSLVKDIISGFFILAEDQFSIGDVVRIAGVSGTVEDIRLRITVLRDLDGNVHYVPNGEITVSSNLTQRYAQVVVDVGVAYATDVDAALGVMGEVLASMAEEDDGVLEEPQVLGVQELGDSAVVLRALLVTAPAERWRVKREALKRLKRRFDDAGIEIPFPQRTVHLRQD